LKKDNLDVNSINLSNGDYYKDQAIDIIMDHKFALVKSVAMTIVTFFTHDGMLTFFQNAGIIIPVTLSKPATALLVTDPIALVKAIATYIQGPGAAILIVRCLWIVVTILFFIGVIQYIRKERINPAILTAIFLVAYFALTTSINGLGVNARFKVPVNIFIFFFALYGAVCIFSGLLSFKKDSIAS
jgi:hypothetical protein